jgi:peptidoglycan hydrolase-like protein with peptidoglycan-binding domain
LKGLDMKKLIRPLVFVVSATAAASVFADNAGTFVDSSTVRQVQETLMQRGFKGLRADGAMGPHTQTAIREFQRSEHLRPTGQLNRQTLVALGIERPHQNAEAAQPAYSPAVVRKAQETLNARGFRLGAANGNMTAATEAAIRQFQKSENLEETGRLNDRTLTALGIEPDSAPRDAAPVAATEPAPSIREVQRRLNALGYDAGSEDGVIGRETRAALMEFQRVQKLPVTGRIDGRTITALRREGNVATR